MKEVTALAISGAGMFFQLICFLKLRATTIEVVADIMPDSAFASPYEAMRCGKNIMTKMPYPNPVMRCISDPVQETRKHEIVLNKVGIYRSMKYQNNFLYYITKMQ